MFWQPRVIRSVALAAVCMVALHVEARPQCRFDVNGSSGSTVAVSGTVAIVGSVGDHATIFRFHQGSGWTLEQVLTGPYSFGSYVAIDGSVAVVGAAMEFGGGAAYVYRHDGAEWRLEQRLVASDGTPEWWFGYGVGVSGDVIAVSSLLLFSSAKVYVYRLQGGSWSEEQILVSSDGGLGWAGYYGSLAISGSVIAVGNSYYDGYAPDAGAVYFYRFDGWQWIEEQRVEASDRSPGDRFGRVSLDRDVALVGAPDDDDAGVDVGSAYVFRHDGTHWVEEQKLSHPMSSTGEWGNSVAVSGAIAAVNDSLFHQRDGAWLEDRVLSGVDTDFVALSGTRLGACSFGIGAALMSLPSWDQYGDGHPGTLGIPALRPSQNPVAGSTITLTIDNPAGAATTVWIAVGLASADLPTTYGGTLLVRPVLWMLRDLPVQGLAIDAHLDPQWIGRFVYLQAFAMDPGASHGVAFTPGLELAICSD